MKLMRKSRLNIIITYLTILILILGAILPSVSANIGIDFNKGFQKGVSWKPLVPMKKVTFVNSNSENLIDDYAYLSSVPANVFYDKKEERIFSNPLLFYQDNYISENEKELSLNARQGIDYFMEDWIGYSNGNLDQMTLINVPKEQM